MNIEIITNAPVKLEHLYIIYCLFNNLIELTCSVIPLNSIETIKKRLDYMSHEIVEIKKLIIGMESDKQKSNEAWNDLMLVSGQLSDKWTDISAVDEIRMQREKKW